MTLFLGAILRHLRAPQPAAKPATATTALPAAKTAAKTAARAATLAGLQSRHLCRFRHRGCNICIGGRGGLISVSFGLGKRRCHRIRFQICATVCA